MIKPLTIPAGDVAVDVFGAETKPPGTFSLGVGAHFRKELVPFGIIRQAAQVSPGYQPLDFFAVPRLWILDGLGPGEVRRAFRFVRGTRSLVAVTTDDAMTYRHAAC